MPSLFRKYTINLYIRSYSILFLYLIFSFLAIAQDPTYYYIGVLKDEPPYYNHSYENRVLIDNLDKDLIPNVIFENYYQSKDFFMAPYKIGKGTIDSFQKRITSRLYTKKAKDGYLYLNNIIMDYIDKNCKDYASLEISYLLDNSTIKSKEGVMKLVGLRTKKINTIVIYHDRKSNQISVYVDTATRSSPGG